MQQIQRSSIWRLPYSVTVNHITQPTKRGTDEPSKTTQSPSLELIYRYQKETTHFSTDGSTVGESAVGESKTFLDKHGQPNCIREKIRPNHKWKQSSHWEALKPKVIKYLLFIFSHSSLSCISTIAKIVICLKPSCFHCNYHNISDLERPLRSSSPYYTL